jgi:hypothetical protein
LSEKKRKKRREFEVDFCFFEIHEQHERDVEQHRLRNSTKSFFKPLLELID